MNCAWCRDTVSSSIRRPASSAEPTTSVSPWCTRADGAGARARPGHAPGLAVHEQLARRRRLEDHVAVATRRLQREQDVEDLAAIDRHARRLRRVAVEPRLDDVRLVRGDALERER